ncbi:uncharacterized protein LOC114255611 isoform X2 [Monomorium pharaonis]|uniref:uncharacterized protein LOC114255611 isoform X2 n=1 Tax=Monomorium pharaonis TaxID=307658 RepID=UPI0017478000|nr:uncharacterized protein LOC114255611 isoform X2 [Monomorium pharaonis]
MPSIRRHLATWVNSCTETENYLKQSRKFRAAKTRSDSANSSDKSSETDVSIKNIPKIPKKQVTTHSSKARKVTQEGNAIVTCGKTNSSDESSETDVTKIMPRNPAKQVTTLNSKASKVTQEESRDEVSSEFDMQIFEHSQNIPNKNDNLPIRSIQYVIIFGDLSLGN